MRQIFSMKTPSRPAAASTPPLPAGFEGRRVSPEFRYQSKWTVVGRPAGTPRGS
jgi:hypothetical protein